MHFRKDDSPQPTKTIGMKIVSIILDSNSGEYHIFSLTYIPTCLYQTYQPNPHGQSCGKITIDKRDGIKTHSNMDSSVTFLSAVKFSPILLISIT